MPRLHYILSITIAVALLVSFIPAADATTCTVHDAIATQVNVTAVPIEVESTTDDYFVLYVLHHLGGTEIQVPVSVTLGVNGTITLSENLEALPKERYVVEKFSVSDPADIDGDCINDITELANPVSMNPKSSHMTPVNITDGAMEIPDWETFDVLSNQSYLKFVISGMETGDPHIYFINSNTHPNHAGFFDSVTITNLTNWVVRGTIFFNVNTTASDGDLGLFTYELYPNNSWPFSATDLAYTMLAANMPIINDNLAQYIPIFNVEHYQYYADQYNTSRLNVVFEEDLIADLESASMNPAEGYGLLRVMNTDDRPGIRDVVIYETIPNEVPRVAGIITTAPQTPLSHVNLRAIQDGIPNAFIRDAINNTKITNLIDTYVHYTVTKQGWKLEPATIVEVNTHHAASRPVGIQIPERDLSVTSIKPLDKIRFNDWDAFGVKAANVAVLGGLGFPDGTVPDGFAIPFYFYDEFMKHNGLYDTVNAMLADADFQTNSDTRELKLKELRKAIKDAETPAWIITKLEKMHAKFPADTSLRYRSSTSNEDLPSFSGAGLYDSKTQDPEETEEDGIDKSLKAVYASLWNFRAFAERDFHRVYHPLTAMGVLVHPNYSDELANGVAVSFDPKSGSTDAYYINTQIGEDLITNPDALSIPEEIMLDRSGVRTIMITTIDPESPSGSGSVPVEIPTYSVLGTSNHMPPWALLLNNQQLGQMRHHLTIIHDTFKDLYGIGPDEQFAMEIEFKITSEDVLAIKQARPWVFYSPPVVEALAALEDFVTVWVTTSANESITIPATGTYTIDWGDGTASSTVTGSQSHSYATAGSYTVTISGDLESISLRGNPENAAKLQSIEQWGTAIEWTTMDHAFHSAANMVYNAVDIPDLSNVTGMSSMFLRTSAFNGNLSGWDVSSVTDMSYVFYKSSFNGDISDWDVSSVTNMAYMFEDSSFKGDISEWDVSSVTDMSNMFTDSRFNGGLSDWDVSSVTNMAYMFEDSSFKGDISEWDVSSVTDMSNMFTDSRFNGDISEWDVSSVTDMSNMFTDSRFNGDISEWDVSSVTDMSNMFTDSRFNGGLSEWDVSSVTDMSNMFTDSRFNGGLSDWDVSSVTNMAYMFEDSSFKGDISEWDVSSVTDMSNMFTDSRFNGDISEWDVSSVTDMSNMFTDSRFNGDLSDWDVSSATNISYMFRGSSFNGDLSDWDVSSVISMAGMFDYSVFNGDISEWDVSSATNISYMFRGSPFNGDISEWDVSSVTDMGYMFTSSLFNGDISDWDVSSVTDMTVMFTSSHFNGNLGNWYITLDNTSVTEIPQTVGSITPQNELLTSQGVTYGIGSGGDSEHFDINDNSLILTTTPDVNPAIVHITSTGDFGTSNSRIFEITFSSEVADTTAPTVVLNPREVTGLTLENAQYGVLVVSWDEPTEAPKKYRVSWAKVGEPYLPKNDPTGNMFLRGTSHTITDLEADEKYKVKVRSMYGGGHGNGPWISTFTIATIK